MDFAGTRPVDERHRLNLPRLEAWLREHLDGIGGPLAFEQFRGGQSNPTYLITPARGRRLVLRRKPPGPLLPSAHAVDREYRVTRALHAAGFPVAQPLLLCEDDSVAGTMFFVMEAVEGRVLWEQALPGLSPPERTAIWDELNRVIAWLHTIDYVAAGLEGFGKAGSYIARQIDRWTRQYRASETVRIEAMDRLIDWLPRHVPDGGRTAIVHGDYRLDNVIFHPTEPRILAVIDWELATLGDPLADFAYHCLSWHCTPEQFRGIAGLDLDALGIPRERRYVDLYCLRARIEPVPASTWDYYIAYNLFRLAAILQGVARRALDGTAASADAGPMAERARTLAGIAWRRVEGS
jgi:aminoglycoside phosphotransferase (APT) family kinase protein